MTGSIFDNKYNNGAVEYLKQCEEYAKEINKLHDERMRAISSVQMESDEMELRAEIFNEWSRKGNRLYYSHPNRGLNWYYDDKNVPNQETLFSLIDFLEKLPESVFAKSKELGFDGKIFKPSYVHFINILFRQIDELQYSYKAQATNFIAHLKNLPLSDREKHILFSMLLFWHGGYPVFSAAAHFSKLKLIEKEFLKMYPSETLPEKEFCKSEQLKSLDLLTKNLNSTSTTNPVEDVPIILHNTSQTEKTNKAHLARGLFEMLTAMGANHDRTTVAKLAFFLINGKEAASKKEYQTLLNAISAENKQPNNETAKAEKETIKSYLQTLNLLKEKE